MKKETDARLAEFVEKAIEQPSDKRPEGALFEAVRSLPYATDSSHDFRNLLQTGRGDCLAKSELLYECFKNLGLECRFVRWRYELPDQPLEVKLLPSRRDVHRAVQVRTAGRWNLVDATHDPPLARLSLSVGQWDGAGNTSPAYEPRGPVLIEGAEDDLIEEELALRAGEFEGTPSEVTERYRTAFNAWLQAARE